jgi:hypothetical protein
MLETSNYSIAKGSNSMNTYNTTQTELKYYVYAYIRKSNLKPYYIGKGKDYRAWTQQNHAVSVPKDKSKIIILESNLTEVGALAIERRLIRWWGRKDLGTGILLNRTDGGDGNTNMTRNPVSEETRKKLSKAGKNRKVSKETREKIANSLKGRTRLPETLLKISESRKEKPWSEKRRASVKSMKGRKISEETKLKISLSKKGVTWTDSRRAAYENSDKN